MFGWFNKYRNNKFDNAYREESFDSQSIESHFNYPSKKQPNFRFPVIPDDHDDHERDHQSRTNDFYQNHYEHAPDGYTQSPVRRRRSYRTASYQEQNDNTRMESGAELQSQVQKSAAYSGKMPAAAYQQERSPWKIPNTPPLFQENSARADLDKQPTFLRKNNQRMPPSPFPGHLQYIDAKPKKTEKDLHIFAEQKQTEPKKFFRPSPFISPVHGRLDTPEAPREKRRAYEKTLEKFYGFSTNADGFRQTEENVNEMPPYVQSDAKEETPAMHMQSEEVYTEPFQSSCESAAASVEEQSEMVDEIIAADRMSQTDTANEGVHEPEEPCAGWDESPAECQAVNSMDASGCPIQETAAATQAETDRQMQPAWDKEAENELDLSDLNETVPNESILSQPQDLQTSYMSEQPVPLAEEVQEQSEQAADLHHSMEHTHPMEAVISSQETVSVQPKADPRKSGRTVPVNAMMFNEDKMHLRKKQLGAEWKPSPERQAVSKALKADKQEMEQIAADHLAQEAGQVNEEIEVCAYEFPPFELLKPVPYVDEAVDCSADAKVQVLNQVLKDFNVGGKVVSMTKGPTVTRYEVQPDPGVKVNKIVNLADDLKLYLAAQDIRIEAPIPGKSMVGIEIPNDHPRPVFLREILEHPDFAAQSSSTRVALGLNIEGMPVSTDICKMPHGLIAGSTGSGKSVCINSILVSLLYQAHPDEVKLMLIDPKMVELASYNALPHLVCPVITDAKAATKALKWAVDEMERRYELFSKIGVRDIHRYNELASRDARGEKMATIIIIIDELADLMMVAANEVESHICRIAQKARACGIHLILATQRPSVDVITGLIKANIPSRIAFSVSSQIDSRTILDSNGAERLLGKGDMLLSENGSSKLVRVQGTYVSDDEIEEVVAFVKKQMAPQYLFTAEEIAVRESNEDGDELFPEILEFAIETGTISTSMIQRKFRIGYNRAARIIDVLEEKGYISGANGSKPREVLIDQLE